MANTTRSHFPDPAMTAPPCTPCTSLVCSADTLLGLAPPLSSWCHALQTVLMTSNQFRPIVEQPPAHAVACRGCSLLLSQGLCVSLHPKANAAFKLWMGRRQLESWCFLPCRPGLYRQRFLREISLPNQLLHQTPEEQSNSVLKHKCTSAPCSGQTRAWQDWSAAKVGNEQCYLILNIEIKLKNKNIHLKNTENENISLLERMGSSGQAGDWTPRWKIRCQLCLVICH